MPPFGRTHHGAITATDTASSSVQGTVLEVTETELALADTFEAQFKYPRVTVNLPPGRDAWGYVHAA